MKVTTTINGTQHQLDVEPRTTLLDALRDELGLKGSHTGCEHGVCGACTVLINGAPGRSCLMLAVQAEGQEITTIEGVAPEPGQLSIVQEAFCDAHAMQCGFCTPGMVLSAEHLLKENPRPTRDDILEAISGNICRCTGYGQIIEAIELASDRLTQNTQESADV
jgi:carbon-monoxide dehydrogenase small subunit